MKTRTTKTDMVAKHLINKGHITSWEAIEKFNLTRLGSVIFNLRQKRSMDIHTELVHGKDKYGNAVQYAKYIYLDGIKKKKQLIN